MLANNSVSGRVFKYLQEHPGIWVNSRDLARRYNYPYKGFVHKLKLDDEHNNLEFQVDKKLHVVTAVRWVE